MSQMKVVAISLPERCEICHQSDQFNKQTNHCSRCNNIYQVVQTKKHCYHLSLIAIIAAIPVAFYLIYHSLSHVQTKVESYYIENNNDLVSNRISNNLSDNLTPKVSDRDRLLLKAVTEGNIDSFKSYDLSTTSTNITDENNTTLLMLAASRGQAKIVQYLLDLHTETLRIDKDNNNALHLAAKNIDNAPIDTMKYLVDAGIPLESKNSHGTTPLMNAAAYGSPEMIKYLVSAGANLEGQDWSNSTALMYALSNNKINNAKTLLELGAKVNTFNQQQENLVAYALTFNNRDNNTLIPLLIEHGAKPNAPTAFDNFPLLVAIKAKHYADIDHLIEGGANINIHGEHGITPLMAACAANNYQLVVKLLDLGAQIDDKDNYGASALYYAINQNEFNAEPIVSYLLSSGASSDYRLNDGSTPLIKAAYWQQSKTIRSLLVQQVDVNNVDNEGHTALYWSRIWGNEEIVNLLLAAGAKR